MPPEAVPEVFPPEDPPELELPEDEPPELPLFLLPSAAIVLAIPVPSAAPITPIEPNDDLEPPEEPEDVPPELLLFVPPDEPAEVPPELLLLDGVLLLPLLFDKLALPLMVQAIYFTPFPSSPMR